MDIQRISENANLGDANSVSRALRELRKVPDHELHYYLVLRDTLSATTPATRQAIMLAQVENERRRFEQGRRLTLTTTILSGFAGLAGVVLGVVLTATLG